MTRFISLVALSILVSAVLPSSALEHGVGPEMATAAKVQNPEGTTAGAEETTAPTADVAEQDPSGTTADVAEQGSKTTDPGVKVEEEGQEPEDSATKKPTVAETLEDMRAHGEFYNEPQEFQKLPGDSLQDLAAFVNNSTDMGLPAMMRNLDHAVSRDGMPLLKDKLVEEAKGWADQADVVAETTQQLRSSAQLMLKQLLHAHWELSVRAKGFIPHELDDTAESMKTTEEALKAKPEATKLLWTANGINALKEYFPESGERPVQGRNPDPAELKEAMKSFQTGAPDELKSIMEGFDEATGGEAEHQEKTVTDDNALAVAYQAGFLEPDESQVYQAEADKQYANYMEAKVALLRRLAMAWDDYAGINTLKEQHDTMYNEDTVVKDGKIVSGGSTKPKGQH